MGKDVVPIGGVEYRRWLAEQGGDAFAAIDVADESDKAEYRRASGRSSQPAPVKPEDQPDEPDSSEPMTPLQHDWLARAIRWESPKPKNCAAVLAAWHECWRAFEREMILAGECAWQWLVERLAARGVECAFDELELIDAEPLLDDDGADDERLNRLGPWARNRLVRDLWRLRYGKPTEDDDKEDHLDRLEESLSAWSNEEISDEVNRLRIERTAAAVAQYKAKAREHRPRVEKVDPKQMKIFA